MTEKAVDMAVAQVAKTFDHWKKTSYAERAARQQFVKLTPPVAVII